MNIKIKPVKVKIKTNVQRIYPVLSDLEVDPSGEKQKYTGSFGNVLVNEIKTEVLNVSPQLEKQSFKGIFGAVNVEEIKAEDFVATPSAEEQTQKGIFKSVTIAGEENYKEENIKAGTSMWGLIGTYEGESPYNVTMANPNNLTSFSLASWITEIKEVDMAGLTSTASAFYGCKQLTKIGKLLNMEKVTHMNMMFNACQSLPEIPEIDFSKVTSMTGFLQNCKSLTTNPSINAPKATNVYGLLESCTGITKVSGLYFPVATDTHNLFYGCTALTEVSDISMPQTTDTSGMCNGCTQLVSFPGMDMSNVINVQNMFYNCSNLKNVGSLSNLGKAFVKKSGSVSQYTLHLSTCSKLTHDSLMNIINGLYDLNLTYDVANGGTLYTQKLVLGSTNIAKLSSDELNIATSKGWKVS